MVCRSGLRQAVTARFLLASNPQSQSQSSGSDDKRGRSLGVAMLLAGALRDQLRSAYEPESANFDVYAGRCGELPLRALPPPLESLVHGPSGFEDWLRSWIRIAGFHVLTQGAVNWQSMWRTRICTAGIVGQPLQCRARGPYR
jgi:hypothetical protein